jgi:hypothetical protein
MMLCLSLLRLLGGNLESKETEKMLNRESDCRPFSDCLFLWIEISCCSVSVSRLSKIDPLLYDIIY